MQRKGLVVSKNVVADTAGWKKKTFPVFPYSYRNTSGSLGEREIEV